MKSTLVSILTFTLFIVSNFSQVLGDYRSAATGNWNAVATWERFNGAIWVAAVATPTSADGVITIQAAHTVTQNIPGLSVDQVIVDGTMKTMTTAALGSFTVANGAGVDLTINGTFWDLFTSGVITWTGTWQFGPVGTLLKTSASSSNSWQGAYNGGIVNIPATSNWVLRKVAAANPVLTTIGAYYGNLTIENNLGGIWNTTVGSTWQGAGGFPTVKGNLDIGGAGSSTVNFVNQQTNAQPSLVLGNVIIRAGNIFQNNGTGLEIRGNLTNNGTISYDANDARKLIFSGAAAQTLTNTGTLGIFDFTMAQAPANTLTLNNQITVDNVATFTSGIVNNSLANLFILNTAATVSGATNASFVNGPVRYLGSSALTFPVGKVNSYRSIATGISSSGPVVNIYTEDFNSGAPGWTLNQVMGAEGADPNFFTISSNEGGCQSTFPPSTVGIVPNLGSPTSCGTVNANATLHVTSVFNPSGGAAYDAGGLCGILFCPRANRQCTTPNINTSGYSGLELVFDYIEGGATTFDNASVYYSINGGGSWILLDDMPKSATGCGGQGIWVTRILSLPATCNNIVNLKFAFLWVNNDDGAGTDPSFALDNVVIRQGVAPSSFTAEYFPSNPQIPYGNVLVPTLTNLSDCEYWILTRDVGIDNRTVTLSWNAATCYNTAFASFEVARHDGISTWQDHDGIVAGTAASGTVTTPAVVTSFSPFAIAYVPLPLPIELLQFNGTCENGKVKLTWQTATEINNDYFTVEKSTDLQHWSILRTIAGAGNSNIPLSYETIDNDAKAESYYRLSQTDYNGQMKYFDPIFVACSNTNNEIVMYPNPNSGIINFSIPNGSVLQDIEVYTTHGQLALRIVTGEVKGGTVHTADFSQLQSGTYYVRINVNGTCITKPVNIIK